MWQEQEDPQVAETCRELGIHSLLSEARSLVASLAQ